MAAIELREAPQKRAICETKMRYDVLLHNKVVGEVYFNIFGYVGLLPRPDGESFWMPEGSLTSFKREIAHLNREFKKHA